jgi:GNAT superfamily N-acetyltransferase
MVIRKINKDEMKEALNLVWAVFLEFEAPDYSEEGIKEFKKAIDDRNWISERDFWGAFENGELLGLIATKNYNHIALFFVDGKFHKQGIGRALFDKVCELNASGYYTVNSSPYARGVYEHLGFEYTDSEQSVNGLKFYPMKNDKILEYIQTKKNSKK